MYDLPEVDEKKGKKRIKFGPHEAEAPEGLC